MELYHTTIVEHMIEPDADTETDVNSADVEDAPVYHVLYTNWVGTAIDPKRFSSIFDILLPIGIDTIHIVQGDPQIKPLINEHTLIVGFGCTNFYSSFDSAPVARMSAELTNTCVNIVGDDDTMGYKYYSAGSMCQSPAISLEQRFDFCGAACNLKDNPIAYVWHGNLINIVIKPDHFIWGDNHDREDAVHGSIIRVLQSVISDALPYLQMAESDFQETVVIHGEKNLLKNLCRAACRGQEKIIEQLNSGYESLRKKESELADLRQKIQTLEVTLHSMRDVSLASAKRLVEEIDKIKDLKMVESVDTYSQIQSGIISFTTKPIYTKTQGRRYYLGSYRVEINILKSSVSFFNLEEDMQRRSHWGRRCHHPHVSNLGTACLGNVSSDFQTAIVDQQYGYLAVLCLSFLSSVNINDVAGRCVVNWPLADNHGNIIKDPAGDLLTCNRCNDGLPDDENELHDSCFQCAICETWHHNKCNHRHEVGSSGLYICDDCHRLGAEVCSVCGELQSGAYLAQNSITGEPICLSCSARIPVAKNSASLYDADIITVNADEDAPERERITECQCCHRLFVKRNDDDTMCQYCQNEENSVVRCADCGTYQPEGSTIEFETHRGDVRACHDCAQHYVVCDDLKFERQENCALTEDGDYHYEEE